MNEFSKYFRDKGIFGKVVLIHVLAFGLFLLALLPWWRPTWIYAAFFLIVGGEAFVVILGIAVALMGLKLVSNPKDFSESAKKVTRFLAALAFWFLMMAILFHDIPSETHFTKVLFVILVFVAIALGTYGGILYFPWAVFRRFCTVQLGVALIAGLFAIKFPYQYERFKIWVSDKLSLSQPVSLIDMTSIADPENFAFWDASGKPIRWSAKLPDGKFILASIPGYHGPTGVRLKPVETAQQRQEIINWIKADRVVKESAEQAARVAEAERIQRQQTADSLARAEQQAAAARSAAEQAAAQHASDLTRYLGTREVRKAGDKQALAVVAVSENGKLNSNVGQVIAAVLKTESVEVTTSRFTPEFVSDGLFAQAFGDSRAILNRLELTNSVRTLLLARQTVQYSTNASLENIITANMRLEVLAVAVADSGADRTLAITASGIGFKPENARSQAEERLSEKIQSEADSLRNATRPNR